MLKGRILLREEPYQGIQEFPWDKGIIRRFHFDSADIALLENEGVLFVGETAYSLENLQAGTDVDTDNTK